MEKHVSVFTKGLDRDTSPYKYGQEFYYEAQNLRPVTDTGLFTGDLTSILGNVANHDFGDKYEYVKHIILRDIIVFFLRDTTLNEDVIVKHSLSAFENITAPLTTVTDMTEILTGDLNFWSGGAPNPVTIIANYETFELNILYFSTPDSEIMTIDLNTTGLSGITPDDIKIVQDITLLNPVISSFTVGNLPVGRVQYAYQLYKSFGSESPISPVSSLFNLTPSAYNSVSSREFRGGFPEQNSNKGLVLSMTSLDNTKFDRIRIYRILYEQINTIPKIDIIAEQKLIDTSFEYTDVGAAALDTITLEEFRELFIRFTPHHLVEKNNYLFAANYEKKDLLSVPVGWDTTVTKYNPYGTGLNSGVINPYNEVVNDPTRALTGNYVYKTNTTTASGTCNTTLGSPTVPIGGTWVEDELVGYKILLQLSTHKTFRIVANTTTGVLTLHDDSPETASGITFRVFNPVLGGTGTNVSYEIKIEPYQIDRRIDNPLSSAAR